MAAGDPAREANSVSELTPPPIAVAIPCYNEAAAIRTVIESWRAAVPEAELVVYDNNSSDSTGDLARTLGVRVVPVPEQGKGHAVRAALADLRSRNAVILVDGDGTYPAEAARLLLEPVLAGRADMAVGARRPVEELGAMSPVRGLGNVLIRAAFRICIGRGPGDLLSGYRVFGPRFLRTVHLRSKGFEIETELATEAVARGLGVVELPVAYYPRIAGTASKLRAVRDGLRILRMIVVQSLRLRLERAMIALAVLVGIAAVALGSRPFGAGAVALAASAMTIVAARSWASRYQARQA